MQLQALAPGLWAYAYETKMMGIAFPCKSFIVERAGKLLVVSPGTWNEGLKGALAPLGQVSELLCPNAFHHVHVLDWAQAYPQAQVYGPPALAKKRPELSFQPVKPGNQPFLPEVELFPLLGANAISENLVYHQASQSLILTDLVFNVQESRPLWTEFMFKMVGIHKTCATSKIFKQAVTDKAALAQSLEPLWGLLVSEVYPNHGDALSLDAAPGQRPLARLQMTLAWLGA